MTRHHPETLVWTAARIATVRELYPSRMTTACVLSELNALPGRTVVRSELNRYASVIGIHREKRALPAYLPAPSSAITVLTQPWNLGNDPIYWNAGATEDEYLPKIVGLSAVASFAKLEGIPFKDWDDLRAVNRRCEQKGLPTFARRFESKGVRG